MPPRHHPPHKDHKHHGKHRRAPLPAALVARLDQGLAALMPDAQDRAFVLRCALEEGPEHHRGANAALLLMLLQAVQNAGGPWAPPPGQGKRPRMHLPPHLQEENEDARYPIHLPLGALRAVTGDDALADDLAEALMDGPPQHAVANVVMVALLDGLLTRAGATP